jgi:hypothetical protein
MQDRRNDRTFRLKVAMGLYQANVEIGGANAHNTLPSDLTETTSAHLIGLGSIAL